MVERIENGLARTRSFQKAIGAGVPRPGDRLERPPLRGMGNASMPASRCTRNAADRCRRHRRAARRRYAAQRGSARRTAASASVLPSLLRRGSARAGRFARRHLASTRCGRSSSVGLSAGGISFDASTPGTLLSVADVVVGTQDVMKRNVSSLRHSRGRLLRFFTCQCHRRSFSILPPTTEIPPFDARQGGRIVLKVGA